MKTKLTKLMSRSKTLALALSITLPTFAASTTHHLPFTEINLENDQPAQERFSDKSDQEKYFTIESVTVRELNELVWKNDTSVTPPPKDPVKDIGAVVMLIDKIVAVGKKIWDIVSAGRPVVQTNMDKVVSVLPRMEGEGTAFYDMEGWDIPQSKDYMVEFKNGFGSAVVSFTYTVFYQAGGTFEEKGMYLTGVNVTATNVEVSWGFDFDATTALVAISNHESKVNPEAGATLQVKYTVKNWLKQITSTETVHVMGRGKIQKIR